jgi:hypothetical protein
MAVRTLGKRRDFLSRRVAFVRGRGPEPGTHDSVRLLGLNAAAAGLAR